MFTWVGFSFSPLFILQHLLRKVRVAVLSKVPQSGYYGPFHITILSSDDVIQHDEWWRIFQVTAGYFGVLCGITACVEWDVKLCSLTPSLGINWTILTQPLPECVADQPDSSDQGQLPVVLFSVWRPIAAPKGRRIQLLPSPYRKRKNVRRRSKRNWRKLTHERRLLPSDGSNNTSRHYCVASTLQKCVNSA